MARGFESKDVEGQQQAAEERRAAAQAPQRTAEEIERDRKRAGLLLQRTRVLREMQTAREGRHRETLKRGLKFLDEELAKLG